MTPVHAVVRKTAELLKRTVDRRIEIDLALDAEVAVVLGAAAQLRSALLNLGLNAAQAMLNGGRLTFRTKVQFMDEAECLATGFDLEPGRFLVPQVCDTGSGVEAEHLARLFEPFFTTKGPGGGTGLGLSVVHGTVLSHGGRETGTRTSRRDKLRRPNTALDELTTILELGSLYEFSVSAVRIAWP